jgi:PAS domain S-box-containing protein
MSSWREHRRPHRPAAVSGPPSAWRSGAVWLAVFRHSAAQQRQHGEDAAVVVLGVGQTQLLEDGLHVPLDGARAEIELLRDRTVRAALCDQGEDRSLALAELVEGGAAAAVDEGLDHLRIERGSPRRDSFDRINELRHVPDALFEQVADARGRLPDELEHVGRLEVLGQDQYRRGRMRAPDLDRGDEAIVRVSGRHADVDDRDVGRVGADLQQQIVRAAGAADDLVSRILQERGDALAQQRVVVGDNDVQRLVVHGTSIEVAERLAGATIRGMGTGDRGARFAETLDLQRVEHTVARILAETDQPVDVYASTLEAVGGSLGWELGAVWEVGPDDGRLRCRRIWHAGEGAPEFEALSERIALAPGEGLPGRVLVSAEPIWIVDAPEDGNFPRANVARRDGLHAAFGFPLLSPRGVVGVMEFFSRELREPDQRLLETMRELGSQVGQFVARRQAEEAVRTSESRLRAMLESALDAVVTMDHRGRVVGWNHAAETAFGYRADEAVGKEMAALIVPPSLRAAHRKGLARFLETAQAVILDRRLELTGMHKNGIEFPVELTITRIPLPGPPTFTGYLRDITERKRVESDLRASRARLVEVADAERRRIQRNLHDGAQQRLTAVLLNLGRLRESSGARDELLDVAIDELSAGLQEIRELASGLHPSVLSERGLARALEAAALRAPVPVELQVELDHPVAERVEAAAYYVVAEGLANVHKHARASRVSVRVAVEDASLVVDVSDDGVGGADEEGAGLSGLSDRVEALGGQLALTSPEGGGTRLSATIPLG